MHVSKVAKFARAERYGAGRKSSYHIEGASGLEVERWMRKGVDGGYGGSAFLGIWVERITLLMRRLVRPYFRVGFILSVCLSVCLSDRTSHNAGILHLVPSSEGGSECSVLSQQDCTEYSVQLKC